MGTGVGVTVAGSDLVTRPAWPGASQSAAPWLPALCPRAVLGTHRRAGMGRAAARKRGRCRQRGGSPGGRRRRRPVRQSPRKRPGPRRRKARARRRRKARPRRMEPIPEPFNPGPLLQELPHSSNSYELLGLCASRDDWRCARSMHEFAAKDIDGHMVCLDKYRGFVCIVTNVASQ